MSSSQMSQRSNKKLREQKECQHHNNQQNKKEENTSSHTFPTEAGVQHVYKAKEDRTIIQSKQAKHQWSKWIWCTTKH